MIKEINCLTALVLIDEFSTFHQVWTENMPLWLQNWWWYGNTNKYVALVFCCEL